MINLPIIALGAGVLAYVVATGARPERIPLADLATPVRVITAKTEAVAPHVIGFGLVRPARTYEAIAPVGGTVDHMNPNLRKGAILHAGAVLLRISPAYFKLAIA